MDHSAKPPALASFSIIVGHPRFLCQSGAEVPVIQERQVGRQQVAAVRAEQAGRGDSDRPRFVDPPAMLPHQLFDLLQQPSHKVVKVVSEFLARQDALADLRQGAGEQADLGAESGADVDRDVHGIQVHRLIPPPSCGWSAVTCCLGCPFVGWRLAAVNTPGQGFCGRRNRGRIPCFQAGRFAIADSCEPVPHLYDGRDGGYFVSFKSRPRPRQSPVAWDRRSNHGPVRIRRQSACSPSAACPPVKRCSFGPGPGHARPRCRVRHRMGVVPSGGCLLCSKRRTTPNEVFLS